MTATIINMKDWVSKQGKPSSKGRPSLAKLCSEMGSTPTQGTRTIPEIKREIRAYYKEYEKAPQ